MAERDNFLEATESCVNLIVECYERNEGEDVKEGLFELTELILRYGVLILDMSNDPGNDAADSDDVELLAVVDSIRHLAAAMINGLNIDSTPILRTDMNESGLDITECRLSYFVEHGFRICDIAAIFGCSRKTVERRMARYGIVRFTPITNERLDGLVQEITVLFPRCGEKTVAGRLLARGIRIPRQRVRDSLLRVDPTGLHARCRNILHRRKYQVASPNALWHLDGYHKLIRWKLIVHGCIDGYRQSLNCFS